MVKEGVHATRHEGKAAAKQLSEKARTELAGFPLTLKTRDDLGLVLRVPAYAQDPRVGEENPRLKIIDFEVNWRPGITDGPTSARVAIVDYDADEGKLHAPAVWNKDTLHFEYPAGKVLDKTSYQSYQFHQVSVWATIESALALYEHPFALGRSIPWGFAGNRLIITPHAGYAENACYDRATKSLQFYYCGPPDNRVYTCLSHDIVAHETGHAILDGIRPLYNEVASAETAAFHEFVADLTQLLCTLRNNPVRHEVKGDLSSADFLVKLGEELAEFISAERGASIRTLTEKLNLADIQTGDSPHRLSQVLTNALFQIMAKRETGYWKERGNTKKEALWDTTRRIIQVGLQPLDYCPPVDIRFADYAAALLYCHELQDPRDEHAYRPQMHQVLEERGVTCPVAPARELVDKLAPKLKGVNFFEMATSRVAIYRFLHEHRQALDIPPAEDLVVLEPYLSNKIGREGDNLPRELVVQYLWREPVLLEGKQYGTLKGERVSLLCGGTLVFDEIGHLRYASLKPGAQVVSAKQKQSADEGEQRRAELTKHLAALAEQDAIAFADETPFGHRGAGMQAIARRDAQGLRLETAPRLHPGREATPWRLE